MRTLCWRWFSVLAIDPPVAVAILRPAVGRHPGPTVPLCTGLKHPPGMHGTPPLEMLHSPSDRVRTSQTAPSDSNIRSADGPDGGFGPPPDDRPSPSRPNGPGGPLLADPRWWDKEYGHAQSTLGMAGFRSTARPRRRGDRRGSRLRRDGDQTRSLALHPSRSHSHAGADLPGPGRRRGEGHRRTDRPVRLDPRNPDPPGSWHLLPLRGPGADLVPG